MRKCAFANLAFIFLLFLFPAAAFAQRSVPALQQFSRSLQELAATISPSVVQITGTGYGLQLDDQQAGANVLSKQRSTGSGIVVSDDGYIMTNAHVVEGTRTIRVKLNGMSRAQGNVFEAKLVGKDQLLDVALLKIEAGGLKTLPFSNSTELQQGELVLAFGSPLGMDNSVSMGIVSSPARQLDEDDPRIFVQTDAPINPGNSGGPLVDTNGRVVGMNTFIFSQSGGSEGIGFAIPSNVIRYAYASLKKDGHVHRGQIGLFVRTITPTLARAFNLEAENGVLVEDVIPDEPADKVGVQVGDVVMSLGGRRVRSVRDLSLELYQYVIGNTVQLQILRGGKPMSMNVEVTEHPTDQQRFADMVTPETSLVLNLAILGLTVDEKVLHLLPNLRYNDGVLVAALSGPSRYFGDQPQQGDVIHTVNGSRVTTVEMLRSTLEQVKTEDPLVLQVERDGRLMFLVLESD